MIQEKDFLYRVPVKNALVTAPGQQVRNPEILVDTEGGEFMRGNILDANSTNKLINQSVKEAVDNKLIESGYVTKDLLDAETTRATEQENSLKTAIDGKADATALSNYVLTTALNKQVDTLNAAISAKQDAGNYIHYETINDEGLYEIPSVCISDIVDNLNHVRLEPDSIQIVSGDLETGIAITTNGGPQIMLIDSTYANALKITMEGISNADNNANHVYATDGSIADLTQYAKKTELPTVPTKTSQLTNDSNFMAANVVQDTYFGLEKGLKIYSEADNKIMTIGHTGIEFETDKNNVSINDNAIDITNNKSSNKTKLGLGFITFYYNDNVVKFSSEGIKSSKFHDCLATSDGTFIPLSEFVDTATYDSKIAALEARITALEAKHPEAAA